MASGQPLAGIRSCGIPGGPQGLQPEDAQKAEFKPTHKVGSVPWQSRYPTEDKGCQCWGWSWNKTCCQVLPGSSAALPAVGDRAERKHMTVRQALLSHKNCPCLKTHTRTSYVLIVCDYLPHLRESVILT